MTALRELAKVIRSKNAGPHEITFDVMFTDEPTFARVRDSGVLTPERLARLYRADVAHVRVCTFFAPALAFKFTLLRFGDQGGAGERDTFGAQQHAPLLDVVVP
ncbi:DUF4387 domain-containing protein [Saccharopolyspora sp. NFXS83]|uniref:DUF4387 domain-containing protein n=1 Tax=Saccharopolyspora sp. NFXS83 TaxID=2993560 RepID=UPI00224B1CE1|nr:DUF4387 domain-containing protein [Saccharopolyspora sp. NFXS83]MCX2730682.1 DUF4387 domain-containing protein [Saccharopolyspora sp. NFXS83]